MANLPESCRIEESCCHRFRMLRIIDSFLRSLLEYTCPLFLNVCLSTLNFLEVIYYAALRVAIGLLKHTPLPLLRREANASCVSRIRFIANIFLARQLSPLLPPFSTDPFTRSAHLSAAAADLLTTYNLGPNHIPKIIPLLLNFLVIPSLFHSDCHIILDGLPFQNISRPFGGYQAWKSWSASTAYTTLFSSDASKDSSKTAVAFT